MTPAGVRGRGGQRIRVVAVRLDVSCAASPFWQKVRDVVDHVLAAQVMPASRWTLTIRRQDAADARMLVEMEGDSPADHWAVVINDDALEVTVAVEVDGDDDLAPPDKTAAFLVDLLDHVAEPDPEWG
jgi:hypothetical protein